MEVVVSIVTGILTAVLAAGGAVWASGRRTGTLQVHVQAIGDRLGDRLGALERSVGELSGVVREQYRDHDVRLRQVEQQAAAHDTCAHFQSPRTSR